MKKTVEAQRNETEWEAPRWSGVSREQEACVLRGRARPQGHGRFGVVCKGLGMRGRVQL